MQKNEDMLEFSRVPFDIAASAMRKRNYNYKPVHSNRNHNDRNGEESFQHKVTIPGNMQESK